MRTDPTWSCLTGSTLSLDFKMQVGAVQQTVEVGAQAALVETSQATQGSSIRQAEVMALPMINRSMATLMTMLPGARELSQATAEHGASANIVSIGGGGGRNYNTLVDGIDNRENTCGGVLVPYSLEGIQEFKLFATGANAEFGRGTANALVSTKSGTNEIHGSGFILFPKPGSGQDRLFFGAGQRRSRQTALLSASNMVDRLAALLSKIRLYFFGSVERNLAELL